MQRITISYTIQSTVDMKISLTDEEVRQIVGDDISDDLHKRIDGRVALATLSADHANSFDERRIYAYFDAYGNKIGQETLLV